MKSPMILLLALTVTLFNCGTSEAQQGKGATPSAAAAPSDYAFEVVAKSGDSLNGHKMYHLWAGRMGGNAVPLDFAINEAGDIAFLACTEAPPTDPAVVGPQDGCGEQTLLTTTGKSFANAHGPIFFTDSGDVIYHGESQLMLNGSPITKAQYEKLSASDAMNHGLEFSGGSHPGISKIVNRYGDCGTAVDFRVNARGDVACWWKDERDPFAGGDFDSVPVGIALNGTVVGKGQLGQFQGISPLSNSPPGISLNERGQIAYRGFDGVHFAGPGIPPDKLLKNDGTFLNLTEFILKDQAVLRTSDHTAEVWLLPEFTTRLEARGFTDLVGSDRDPAATPHWAINGKNQIAAIVRKSGEKLQTYEFLIRGTPKRK